MSSELHTHKFYRKYSLFARFMRLMLAVGLILLQNRVIYVQMNLVFALISAFAIIGKTRGKSTALVTSCAT